MRFYIKAAALLLCAALSAALCSCGGEAETTQTDTEAEPGTEQQVHTVHEYESEIIAEPGCEETGVIKYTCACGESYEENLSALGHDFVAVRTVEPTFFTNGYTVYECSRCGATEQRDPTEYTGGAIELPVIEF